MSVSDESGTGCSYEEHCCVLYMSDTVSSHESVSSMANWTTQRRYPETVHSAFRCDANSSCQEADMGGDWIPTTDELLQFTARIASSRGGGDCPKPRHCPKCDTKHCLTNTKHQHIGAKRSVLWPSKYAKMCFWPLRSTLGPTGGGLGFSSCCISKTSPVYSQLITILNRFSVELSHMRPRIVKTCSQWTNRIRSMVLSVELHTYVTYFNRLTIR